MMMRFKSLAAQVAICTICICTCTDPAVFAEGGDDFSIYTDGGRVQFKKLQQCDLEQVWGHIVNRRFYDALMLLQQGLRFNPEEGELHRSIGLMALINNKYELAQEQLQKAKLLTPEDARIHLYLAENECTKSDIDSCIKGLRDVKESYPQIEEIVDWELDYIAKHKSRSNPIVELYSRAKTFQPDKNGFLINVKYERDEIVNPPTLPKTGKELFGWYHDPKERMKWDPEMSLLDIDNDITEVIMQKLKEKDITLSPAGNGDKDIGILIDSADIGKKYFSSIILEAEDGSLESARLILDQQKGIPYLLKLTYTRKGEKSERIIAYPMPIDPFSINYSAHLLKKERNGQSKTDKIISFYVLKASKVQWRIDTYSELFQKYIMNIKQSMSEEDFERVYCLGDNTKPEVDGKVIFKFKQK